jgi:hypothetical protein
MSASNKKSALFCQCLFCQNAAQKIGKKSILPALSHALFEELTRGNGLEGSSAAHFAATLPNAERESYAGCIGFSGETTSPAEAGKA